ncbi:MAG: NAD-dependent epimerase/dehydratase family protein [Planctomycetota bacterium]|nr:NAD-dependent epimerase/dehydratase family protein [Planctomycetota bacterium]
MRRVFLTGATGFLGVFIARALRARGCEVHVLVRSTSDRSRLDGLDLTWHVGDLTSGDDVQRAVGEAARGADGLDLIHSGALISYRTRDGELSRLVNVEGTRHVLDACRLHGVRRLVHVSSMVTVGHSPTGRVLDEDAPYNGAELGVHYVTTKRAAEELVLAAAAAQDVVVVNPGAVFGPAPEDSNSAWFLLQMARGAVRAVPHGGVAVVGVEDVADGCLRALDQGVRGRRYLLTESNPDTLSLVRCVANLCGVRPARLRVPAPVWVGLRGVVSLIDRIRPLERATPQAMRMTATCFFCDSSRAREELGWTPGPFEEVVRAALAEMNGV